MPKFSAIIPVYNVSRYIRKCLDGFLAQTFGDFEVLCIDDCSTDNSAYIIEEYVKNDSRFKLIRHEKNSGPGIARNTGFDNANGEYVVCIDPDDMFDITLFEKLNNIFDQTDADCVWYNAGVYDERTKEKRVIFTDESIFNKDGFYDITPNNIYKGADYIWNKAFKTSVIKNLNLRFPQIWFGEDSQFYFETFTKIKRIYYTHDCLYLYRQRNESTVDLAKQGKVNFEETFTVYMNIFHYCKENNILNEYRNALCQMLYVRIMNRSIVGQNETIIRIAQEVLSKINFPNCFSLEN